MTIEERLVRLEQRIDQLDRIEEGLETVAGELKGFRAEFTDFRADQAQILGRILATLDSHDHTLREIADVLPRLGFRWPWERRP